MLTETSHRDTAMANDSYTETQKNAEAESRGAIRGFFKEFWLWILIPVLIVAGGILLLIFWGQGSESSNPFTYNVF
jgi:hypothetical protein